MVIAVDYDGTLSLGPYPETGPANDKLVNYIKERQRNGDRIILWTCREGNVLEEAIMWCEKQGLVFDAINDNLPEIIDFWGSNSRKISCDLYIDDKSTWDLLYEKHPIQEGA